MSDDALYERLITLALSDDSVAIKYVAMLRENMLKQEVGSDGYNHLCMMMDQFFEAKKTGDT